MSKKTEVVTTEDNLVSLYDEVTMTPEQLATLAADAKDVAAHERPAVSRIGLRAGMLSVNGEAVKGNKLRVVALMSSAINTYYTTGFNPDVPSNPTCFALATMDEADDMRPHESVEKPMSDKCATCPKFQWGTDVKDGKPGRGKACKESRRIILLPADSLSSVEDVLGAELAMMKLPVTSVKVWGTFVNSLSATVNLPPYAAVTELSTQPDIKTQFKVTLTPVAKIANPAILDAVRQRFEMASKIAATPYSDTEGEEAPVPAGQEKF